MAPASKALVAATLFASLSIAPLVARADHSWGTETVVGSPTIFASMVGSSETGQTWFFVAHHLPDRSATRLYITETFTKIRESVFSPHDDVTLPYDALTLSWLPISELWRIGVNADLPNLGPLDIRFYASQVGVTGTGCLPWYEFRSPSRGLGIDGILIGTIDGNEVQQTACAVWGSDVYGYYFIPPLGQSIQDP